MSFQVCNHLSLQLLREAELAPLVRSPICSTWQSWQAGCSGPCAAGRARGREKSQRGEPSLPHPLFLPHGRCCAPSSAPSSGGWVPSTAWWSPPQHWPMGPGVKRDLRSGHPPSRISGEQGWGTGSPSRPTPPMAGKVSARAEPWASLCPGSEWSNVGGASVYPPSRSELSPPPPSVTAIFKTRRCGSCA